MRGLVIVIVLGLTACGQKDSGSASGSASADKPVATRPPEPPPKPPEPAKPPPPEGDGSDEVAQLVVQAVGSKALGSQTIEASCVTVSVVPAGNWTVASAWLKDCGDKTARSLLWLYKRPSTGGKWNEDYAGQPPKCWKGVPPDIARAVTIATKLPAC